MKRKKIDCKTAKELCLISLLSSIGLLPKNENQKDAWYPSPFREETNPSFKVSKKLNRWYDHGEGIGGNTLDFVIKFKKFTVKEALLYLSDNSFSFHQQYSYLENLPEEKKKYEFKIVKTQNLQNHALINYLKSRKITYEIARLFCFEIYYKNNGKRYFSIAFKNDSGGLELRNKYFKGCYGKKDIRTIKNGSKTLNIFEGFIDFLSFLTLKQNKVNEDFMITNSTCLVEKSLQYLKNYDVVKTFFDNDESGIIATKLIQKNCKKEFRNMSEKYKEYKDLNDYLLAFY